MSKHRKKLFYVAYFLYLSATTLQMTMFTQYTVLSTLFAFMRYSSFGIAGIKIVSDLYQVWNFPEDKAWKKAIVRHIAVYTISMLMLGIVSLRTGDRTLVFVGVLLLASKGIAFDEIVGRSLGLQCGLMIVVVVSSSFNIIPDLLFKRVEIPIRHALGYTYPSVMVTSCLFVFLLYLWKRNSFLNDREFAEAEIFNLLIYKLTDSRTGFLAFGVVALILWAAGKKRVREFWKEHKIKKEKAVKAAYHIYDYLAAYLSAALFLLCAAMPLGITQRINSLLTDRIRLTANAFRVYGIHLFGSRIEWIGYGGSTDTDSLLASYNFVDSSYGYVLVNYGILVFGAAIAAIIVSSKYVRKTESRIRQFIYCSVVLYCFIEPRLLEIHVNSFLFLVVPAVCQVITKFKETKKIG